ncbi:MAG: hypothetical protein FJW35_13165 [Acidobacteria bacterium]|nr:hypothetical protein [Acidobacteriota bacterium]
MQSGGFVDVHPGGPDARRSIPTRAETGTLRPPGKLVVVLGTKQDGALMPAARSKPDWGSAPKAGGIEHRCETPW